MTCHCLISSSEDEKKSSFIVSSKRIKPHANSSHGHLFPLCVKEFSYLEGNPSSEGTDEGRRGAGRRLFLFYFSSGSSPSFFAISSACSPCSLAAVFPFGRCQFAI